MSEKTLLGTAAATPLGWASWSMLQGARDPYYILVIIYIFQPYFASQVVGDPVRGQALIGYTTSIPGVLLAILAPLMGAIADRNPRRKPWIAATVLVMAPGSFALWFVQPAGGEAAIWLFVALLTSINLAFGIQEVFQNAMLPSIAPTNRLGLVSGLGYSLGNLSGLILMLLVLLAFSLPGVVDWPMVPSEPLFGLDQETHQDDRIVGPIAAVWMLVFTLPLLLFTPDGKASGVSTKNALRAGVKDLLRTLRQLPHYANIARYLLARMFYNDGMIGILTFAGIYASGVFSWDTFSLLVFGLCLSASAMIGGWLGGRIDDHLGAIPTLKVCISVVLVLVLAAITITPDSILFIPVGSEKVNDLPFFSTWAEIAFLGIFLLCALFFVTGLSASRTLMARITPPKMSTQFFGLYALSGTVTAFLAPLLVAITTDQFQSQQVGIGSLSILLLIGLVMLFWVKEKPSQRAA